MTKMSNLKLSAVILVLCLTSLLSTCAAGSVGPVAEWNFDEGKGKVAHDSSGNGRDATLFGASWVKQGSGFSISLDGVDDYVEFVGEPPLGLTGPVSVEVWINPTRKAEAMACLLGQDLHTYLLCFAGTDRCFWYIGSGSNYVSTQIKLNEWNHVAAVFDGEQMSLWLNGRLITEKPSKIKTYERRDRVSIGTKGRPDLPKFQGLIDNVRLYDRVLSKDEIVAHFLEQAPDHGIPVPRVPTGPTAGATTFFQQHPNAIDLKQEGDSLLFANRQIGLEFQKGSGGFQLLRMVGIADEQDFLSPVANGEPRDLFEIQTILDPKHAGRDDLGKTQGSLMGIVHDMAKDAFPIGSQDAKSVSWHREGDDSKSVLHLKWQEIDIREEKGVFDIAVTVTLRAGDPLAYWHIHVRNRSTRYGIERVRFPILNLAPIGKAEQNVLVVPVNRGSLVENPFQKNLGILSHPHLGFYTCDYEMQFQALYNKQSGSGIYLATQQSIPCLMHPQVDSSDSELVWRPGHFPPNISFAQESPGSTEEDFTLSYDCVAGPFQGDWFDACQIYRKWAIQQSWCSKGPLSMRDDIPKWYKEAPLYFYTTFNDSAQGTHSMDENLAIAADHFREWLKWAGLKLPANFYAWEEPVHGLSVRDLPFHVARSNLKSSSGRWAGMTGHNYYDGNYPTVHALANLSEECARLRQEGGMVCPYIALEIFNQGPSENAPYATEAKPSAIRDLYGCIRTWGGDRAWQMCSCTPWWRSRLTETCLELLKRENVGGFYLDVMRGSSLPCYWPAHGHTVAGGSSMTTGRHELVEIIRQAVKAREPAAIITGENPSENMIDVIDGMLTFTLSADTKAPIFATVYQDYIPRYGLELSTGVGYNSRFEDVHRPESFFIECASLFCEGAQVGRLRLRPRDASLSFQNPEHKEMIDFLGQIVGYYKQEEAKKFLVYGQLMRPLDFVAPSPMPMVTYTAMYVKTESQFPTLMSGVFRAEDGDLGIFVVNASSDEQKFKANIDLARHGITGNGTVDVDTLAPDGTSEHLLSNVKSKVTLQKTLPGRGIIMVRLKPTAR